MKKFIANVKRLKEKDLRLIITPIVALIVFSAALMGFEVDALRMEQIITMAISFIFMLIGFLKNPDKKPKE
jgi:hypothetical protein